MDQENLAPQKPEPTEYRNSKGGILSVLLVVLIIATAGYSAWLFVQKGKLAKNIESTEAIIEAQLNQELPEDSQEVGLQSKKLFLETKKEKQLFWTNVMVKLLETIPDGTKIETNNFTGNSEGNLSFSARTTRASIDPYLDTATLIAKFKDKPFFKNVFVPSISSSVSEQGEEFLSYTVRFNYEKDATDVELLEVETDSTTTDDSEPSDSDINKVLENLRSRTESTDDVTEDTDE